AVEHKLVIVREPIEDDGISGDDLNRAGLVQLEAIFQQAYASGQRIRCLVVDQADRLSRADSIDTSELIAQLRRYGVRWVVTARRVFDLRDAMDRTLFQIEADHKHNPFLKEIARRSLNGTIGQARAGFWSGRVPLGYRLVKHPGDHPAGKRL